MPVSFRQPGPSLELPGGEIELVPMLSICRFVNIHKYPFPLHYVSPSLPRSSSDFDSFEPGVEVRTALESHDTPLQTPVRARFECLRVSSRAFALKPVFEHSK